MEQCNAKLIYSWMKGEVIDIEGLHFYKCCFKNSIGNPEDEGIKIKEESTIQIGKETSILTLYLLIPLLMHPKVAKPKMICAYIKMETLTDSICTSQRSILPSKVWEQ
eukprot:15341653-Ditylum_brightwellii.AAC.1